MYYVYIIRSLSFPEKIYIGFTLNLKNRLVIHNNGQVPHTSKFKPWEFISFFAFNEKIKAVNFEIYLKSGSGREFLKKRLINLRLSTPSGLATLRLSSGLKANKKGLRLLPSPRKASCRGMRLALPVLAD